MSEVQSPGDSSFSLWPHAGPGALRGTLADVTSAEAAVALMVSTLRTEASPEPPPNTALPRLPATQQPPATGAVDGVPPPEAAVATALGRKPSQRGGSRAGAASGAPPGAASGNRQQVRSLGGSLGGLGAIEPSRGPDSAAARDGTENKGEDEIPERDPVFADLRADSFGAGSQDGYSVDLNDVAKAAITEAFEGLGRGARAPMALPVRAGGVPVRMSLPGFVPASAPVPARAPHPAPAPAGSSGHGPSPGAALGRGVPGEGFCPSGDDSSPAPAAPAALEGSDGFLDVVPDSGDFLIPDSEEELLAQGRVPAARAPEGGSPEDQVPGGGAPLEDPSLGRVPSERPLGEAEGAGVEEGDADRASPASGDEPPAGQGGSHLQKSGQGGSSGGSRGMGASGAPSGPRPSEGPLLGEGVGEEDTRAAGGAASAGKRPSSVVSSVCLESKICICILLDS